MTVYENNEYLSIVYRRVRNSLPGMKKCSRGELFRLLVPALQCKPPSQNYVKGFLQGKSAHQNAVLRGAIT
jgi:hypothetical protein